MAYHPHIHHRRSIRLKGYDYSQAGLYFITLCCQDSIHLFGKISNESMVLNHFGKIIKEEWEKTEDIRKNVALHEYIIMPNHFHSILEILYSKKGELKSGDSEESKFGEAEFKSPSQTIGAIIRGFKGASTKRINTIIREGKRGNSAGSKFGENSEGSLFGSDTGSVTGELPFAPTGSGSDSGESKSGKSLFAAKGSIWQRNYYEHIIRNEKAYQNIRNYIIKNPANWKKDTFQ